MDDTVLRMCRLVLDDHLNRSFSEEVFGDRRSRKVVDGDELCFFGRHIDEERV